jgi:hypothetical protein
MTTNYTKRLYVILNDRKIFQMVIKYNNIFHSKVWKQTIWQPWTRLGFIHHKWAWNGKKESQKNAAIETVSTIWGRGFINIFLFTYSNIFRCAHFSQIHTMTMHIKFWQQHCDVSRPKKPCTLVGFKHGIFCSGGGREDHYATPPAQRGFINLQLGCNYKIRTYFT